MACWYTRTNTIKENEKCEERIGILDKQISDIFDRSLSIIPTKYIYKDALWYLKEMISTGRVDNLNMALDKLDEQEHRWKVEDQNEQILSNQAYQNEKLGSIEVSSSIAATNSFFR